MAEEDAGSDVSEFGAVIDDDGRLVRLECRTTAWTDAKEVIIGVAKATVWIEKV